MVCCWKLLLYWSEGNIAVGRLNNHNPICTVIHKTVAIASSLECVCMDNNNTTCYRAEIMPICM